jgi:hypothetical protein
MFGHILKALGLAVVVIAAAVVGMSYMKAYTNPYGAFEPGSVELAEFTEVSFPFSHQFDVDRSLPFLGSAIIDVDGDTTPEVFMGGGYGQADMILEFDGAQFIDATSSKGRGLVKAADATTFGAAVIDSDGDGRSDIYVARDSGITLYLNTPDGFEARPLDIRFNDASTPLSLTLADLNHDGFPDMFVSTYIKLSLVEGQNIFNKEGYGSTSLLLMNNGDNSFSDVTAEAGLDYIHNTFVAVFSDVDRDGDQDIVVAHDTGQVRTWRNNGDLTFTSTVNPSSDRYGYPMGVAVGDYNNDTRMDFFFSNVGGTPPRFLASGDLRDDQIFHTELFLFRNDGEFEFTDAAEPARVAAYGFSWGAVFDDFNNDALEDLLIAQNYVSLPLQKIFRLPGRLLMQLPDGTFTAAEDEAGLANRNFAITPLVADFNNDGYRDVVHVNLAGPSRAFINDGGLNAYLKVRLPDTPASLGAMVEVTLDDGTTLTQQFTSGEGLASDQSHEMIFGLGTGRTIAGVGVHYADGRTAFGGRPAPDSILTFN